MSIDISEVIALITGIPQGAEMSAVQAAQMAQAAAELAAQRSFAVTEEGEAIIFTSKAEGSGE